MFIEMRYVVLLISTFIFSGCSADSRRLDSSEILVSSVRVHISDSNDRSDLIRILRDSSREFKLKFEDVSSAASIDRQLLPPDVGGNAIYIGIWRDRNLEIVVDNFGHPSDPDISFFGNGSLGENKTARDTIIERIENRWPASTVHRISGQNSIPPTP